MDYRTPLSPEAAAELDAAAAHDTDRPDLDAIAVRVDANAADPITLVESANLSLWRRSAVTWSHEYDDWERPTSYDRGALLLDVDPDDGERDGTAAALADLVQATEDRAALLAEVDRLIAERDQARASAIDYAHQLNEAKRDLEVQLNEARRERDQARAELATARRQERERCAAAIEGHVTVVRASNDRKSVGCYRRAQNTIRALPDEGTPTGPREYRLAGPVLTPAATGTTHTVLPLAGDHGDASLVLPDDYDRADLAQAVLGDHSSPENVGYWQRLMLSELLDISDDEDSLDTPTAAMWETAYTAACRARARAYGDTPKAQPAEASPHECGATWEPTGTGATYVCTQRPGHQGAHQSPSDARWLDVSPNATPARTTTEET